MMNPEQDREMTAKMADVHLIGIGRANNGAVPEQVAQELLSALTASAGSAVAGLGVGNTLESLEKSLASGAASEVSKRAREIEGGIEGRAGQGANEAAKSIKGLLGR